MSPTVPLALSCSDVEADATPVPEALSAPDGDDVAALEAMMSAVKEKPSEDSTCEEGR